MKILLTLTLSSLISYSYASSCPAIIGKNGKNKLPHIFVSKSEFEQKYKCKIVFKQNPEISILNNKIKGNIKVLPKVSERLPKEPLIVIPYRHIGIYGGQFNGVSKATESGTSDLLSIRHVNLVRYSDDLTTIVPNIAKSWKANDNFTKFTFTLRKGHKWSDGKPFTAADIEFWYNNLLMDPNIIKKPSEHFLSGGEKWLVKAIDPQTILIKTKKPQPGLISFFATNFAQPFQPKHLLSQFDPKINKDANVLAQEIGFKDGYDALTFYYGRSDWKDIPTPINKNLALSEKLVKAGYPATAPTLESYIVIDDTAEGRVLVANPFFFQVDTAGNQLPYINEIKETFINNEDIQTVKMIAGGVTYKSQSINLPSLPVLLENRDKGKYNISLRPNIGLAAFSFNVNDKNPELRKIFSDIRFRKAASHAFNRKKMNEVAFLKIGKPMQYTVFDPDSNNFVTQEQKQYLIEYNPEKSRKLLKNMGLTYGKDGIIILPSGKKFKLTLKYTRQAIPTELAEVFAKNMTDIGIKVNIKEVTSDEYRNSQSANDLDILSSRVGSSLAVMSSNASEVLKAPFGSFFALRNGLEWMKWNETNGKEGIKPPSDFMEIADLATKFTSLKPGSKESNELGKEIINKWLAQLLIIGTVKGVSPIYYSKKLGNFAVPKTSSYEYYRVYPYLPTQWFIKK